MKSLFLFCIILSSHLAFAQGWANRYDDVVLDCIDYGHTRVSAERLTQCKAKAKNEVLFDARTRSAYLDCIDYGHGTITAEQDEACLRHVSRY